VLLPPIRGCVEGGVVEGVDGSVVVEGVDVDGVVDDGAAACSPTRRPATNAPITAMTTITATMATPARMPRFGLDR
jgi:hypothetical protein